MDEKPQLESRPNGNITKIPTTIGVSDENGHTVDIADPQAFRRLSSPSPTYLGTTPTQSYLGSTSQQPFRRRCDSMTKTEDGDQNESKVLVIYTGGTIGMIRNDDNSKWFNLGDQVAFLIALIWPHFCSLVECEPCVKSSSVI